MPLDCTQMAPLKGSKIYYLSAIMKIRKKLTVSCGIFRTERILAQREEALRFIQLIHQPEEPNLFFYELFGIS